MIMNGMFQTKLFALLCVAALMLTGLNHAHAQSLSCPATQQINEQFDNGAAWQMCWEARQRENIVLSEVSYTPPGGTAISVLASLRMSQLHVAYDDSLVTYNDITQFGLGGGFRTTLTQENCPGGDLINIGGQPGMCLQRSKGDDAYRTPNESILSESLTLFSVSQVGSYAYIVTWKFFADGSIAPSVGASGALQRSSDFSASLFGRQLEDQANKSWLSHTHNYYWQIDFDIGDSANDDVVTEISYNLDQQGRRAREETRMSVEAARKIDPENLVSWKVSDNATGGPSTPSYLIEPLHYGHRLVRSEIEPFTDFDFFVTRQNDCEVFISENARFNPDCFENILQFVNDESLQNQDITVWHRVAFHHVPRNEDRRTMHSHWDGFTMRATNINPITPGHSGIIYNTPPIIASLADQSGTVGQSIEFSLEVSDIDNDPLEITSTGLPTGLILGDDGIVRGELAETGNFLVTIEATDSQQVASTQFNWQVQPGSSNDVNLIASDDFAGSDSGNNGNSSGGSGGGSVWILPFMLLLVRLRKLSGCRV